MTAETQVDAELRGMLADAQVRPWWSWRLPGALERRFASETEPQRNRQLRVWIVVGFAFCWLSYALDLVSVPDVWRFGLLLRLGVVTPVSLAALRVLGTGRPHRLVALAIVAPPAVALLTTLLGFAASAQVDTFRAAIVLAIGILWMNVLMPMRLRDALIFTLVTLALGDAINVGGAAMHRAAIAHADVIVATHVLVALSLLARLLAEHDSRRSFVLGLRLRLRADDLARANAKLLEMSNTDPLTGLANRQFFDLALARAWQDGAAAPSGIALMMIDVDDFKLFNDTAGHLEGDRCLTIIARAIADHVREARDLPARFGGEEFVVLMPATELDQAWEIAERVHTAIAALQVFHPGRDGRGFVSVSIGVAAMRASAPDATPVDLLAAADGAVYAAKAAGRDRVMRAQASAADAARAGRPRQALHSAVPGDAG